MSWNQLLTHTHIHIQAHISGDICKKIPAKVLLENWNYELKQFPWIRIVFANKICMKFCGNLILDSEAFDFVRNIKKTKLFTMVYLWILLHGIYF